MFDLLCGEQPLVDGRELERKFDSAFKGRLISPSTPAEILEKVRKDSRIRLFLRRVAEEDQLRSILLLQRHDLFGHADEVGVLYFHLARPLPRAPSAATPSVALTRLVNAKLEFPMSGLVDDGISKLAQMSGLSEDEVNALFRDFQDVLAYFFILFLRGNPQFKQLITAQEFNYAELKAAFGDYSGLSFEFAKNLDEPGAVDSVIEAKIQNLLGALVSTIATNFEQLAEQSGSVIPSLLMPVHLTSQVWIEGVLQRAGISYTEYVRALDILYAEDMISNASTVLWCENCSLERMNYTQHVGPIAPSKLDRIKCWNCSRKYSYGTLFALSPDLRDMMLTKDGFLSTFIGFLLTDGARKVETGVYAGDYECDFLVDDTWLIECKMHKADRDEEASFKTLDQTIGQTKKQVQALVARGREIKRVTIVLNQPLLSEKHQRKLREKHRPFWTQYGLEIVDAGTFPSLLKSDD